METRKLRVSEYKDYVAVDIVDEDGKILSTPFYYNGKERVKIQVHDEDGDFWDAYEVLRIDYENNRLKVIDVEPRSKWEDVVFWLDFSDLLEPEIVKFYSSKN